MDYDTLTNQSRHNAAIESEEMNLVALLRPRVFMDGNKWCVLYGDDLMNGVAGFGDSPILAVYDFNKAWRRDIPNAGASHGAAPSAPVGAEDVQRRLDQEESDHGRTIDQRDAAEDALGRMFQAVTGRPAEWSSAWGYVDAIEEVEEHVAALEAAREDACVSLVADIRFACGDNGKRMQPELVEFIRGLAEDAARYRWLQDHRQTRRQGDYMNPPLVKVEFYHHEAGVIGDGPTLDAAIDQARGKGVAG